MKITGLHVDSDARFISGSSRLFIPESVDDALMWIWSDNLTLASNVTAKQPMFIDNKFVVRFYFLWEDQVTNETFRLWDKVFRTVEKYTCLKFWKTHQEVDSKVWRPGIIIDAFEDNCATNQLGRVKGPTIIMYGACGTDEFIGVHELLHVLGFEHEHSRPDRDRFLKINWGNIAQGRRNQFGKSKLNPNLGMDIYDEKYFYDYFSIMHYPALNKSFPTMTAKCTKIQLDKRMKLSPLDIKKLNFYYNCDRFRFLIPAYKDNPAYWFYTNNNTFGFRGSNDNFAVRN
ncbi:zinc metalloproteinase nas-4-like protein [Leptotrombidium deliense]|uniref:Metalloendopeptidase n=1 Tax=Leptotrombidium deliense TaxID=299467 RepID=A0A443S9J1_9ACAR|nr:zinc metalloproteinase nas-4-like protein [Leptotrombidium deliense]